eukprot:XP_014049518.1 PREDICTED: small G protein signaling modulator 3-like isoform X1 [Salmo salar]
MSGGYTPAPGGPFSALTSSMWPQDILAKYYQKDPTEEAELQYDEFGFRLDSDGKNTHISYPLSCFYLSCTSFKCISR